MYGIFSYISLIVIIWDQCRQIYNRPMDPMGFAHAHHDTHQLSRFIFHHSINPDARFLPSLNVYWSYFEETRTIVEESLMEIFEHHKSRC